VAIGLFGWLSAWTVAAPPPPAIVLTILDGAAAVTLGARNVAAVEGLRLPAGALVETSATTTLLRLEWLDGTVVDLGPETRVMVAPGALGRKGEAPPDIYLLRGWIKHRSAAAAPHRGHVSPQLDVLPAQGVAVAHVAPELSWLFVESGSQTMVERGGAGSRLALGAGASYLRRGAAKGEVAQRPDPELLKRVPRGFRDTIAARAKNFAGREVEPKPLPAPDYAALRPWLAAEPALRREFPRRFTPLLREPGFRAALAAQLPAHPEWERVLYPERFVNPASVPTGVRR